MSRFSGVNRLLVVTHICFDSARRPGHHAASEFEAAVILAQTMAEYGVLNSIAARLAAAQYRIEAYIGSGNLKYVFLGLLVLIVLLLARRSRRPRWY